MAALPQVRTSKVIYLWPEQLKERKGNNRFDYGNLDELGKSFLSKGIITPLKVRKTKEKTEDDYPVYEVLVGNRRSKAAKKVRDRMIAAGYDGDFVPAELVADDITEADIIAMSVITDEHGKARNMLEIGHDIQALLLGDDKIKQKDVAKLIGKSEQYISDCMLLMEKASPALQAQIKAGKLGAYQAVEMLKANSAEAVETIVEKAIGKKEKETSVSGKTPSRKQLKKSELEEAHGAPVTQKGKKSAAVESSRTTAGSDTKEVKEDATLIKLKQLRETFKANAGAKKASCIKILNGIISFATGKANALDLLPFFFWDIDAESDAMYIKDSEKPEVEVAPKKAVAPAPKKAPAKEVKAPLKPTKGAVPLNKKGKKADTPLEDINDLLEEDDDFEE